MRRHRLPCIVLLFLIIPGASAFTQEKSLLFLFKDGSKIEGTLLHVRDSTLVVDFGPQEWKGDGPFSMETINVLRVDAIDSVFIEGNNATLYGILIGAAVGLGVAVLWASSIEEEMDSNSGYERSTYPWPAFFAVMGPAAGWRIGIWYQKEDKYLDPKTATGRNELRNYAVYPFKEPEFLREIQ